MLGHEALAPLNQGVEHAECSRTQGSRLPVHKQLPGFQVQFKVAEAKRGNQGTVGLNVGWQLREVAESTPSPAMQEREEYSTVALRAGCGRSKVCTI